ncbi:MAG: hypothetical protein Q3987_09110, partial [Oscillospiraceae bacterium]|nr:hypothetical protein [Oscillospiraceae bacterium]
MAQHSVQPTILYEAAAAFYHPGGRSFWAGPEISCFSCRALLLFLQLYFIKFVFSSRPFQIEKSRSILLDVVKGFAQRLGMSQATPPICRIELLYKRSLARR